VSAQLRALRDAARDALARVDRDLAKASPPVAALLAEIRRHAFDELWTLRPSRRADADEPAERFRAELGQSPSRYLAGVRVETASRLLRDSDLAVGTVSLLVGYSDAAPLRRAFKAFFGVPPAELRRQVRAAADTAGGFAEELLGFEFWDRFGRGALEPSQALRLVVWLEAAQPPSPK
jgi:methylphosphotriester-DNA--protein-cysteine methyltransferase